MIKILQVVSSLHKNGTETAIMNLYSGIDRSKYQFDFLIFDNSDMDYKSQIEEFGGRIFYIPSRSHGFLKYNINLWKFFKKYSSEYDVIHFNFCYISTIAPFLFAKIRNIKKRIIHAHSSNFVGGKYNLWLHRLFRSLAVKLSTDYVACSNSAANWFYKNTYAYDKFHLIINGIDVLKFRYSESVRQQYRKKLNVRSNTLVIAQIGYFTEVKNHIFSVEIAESLKKLGVNFIMVFIGDGGNLKTLLQDTIKEKELENDIQFLGKRNDVEKLLQAVDVVIQPSLFEGLPLALVEAQVSGVQVLCSNEFRKKWLVQKIYISFLLTKVLKYGVTR